MPWDPQAIGPTRSDMPHSRTILRGELGVALEVVARPGGKVAVDHHLGHAPAHPDDERVLDVLARVEVPLLGRELLGDPEGEAGRDDAHLEQGIGVGEHVGEHGVAALVEGDTLLFEVREHEAVAGLAHEDPVPRRVEVAHLDELAASPHGVQSRLVDEVGQVRTGHARGATGDDRQVHVGPDPLVLAVHLQDRQALVEVGKRHDDLAVEAARSQQRGVQDVGPVGRGHYDDALGDVETVHFVQHLVQGLLALIVPAAEPSAALAPDRVDLVDEDDGRRLLAGGLEQVADPARTDAHEHLHEVRTAHREEGNARLAGHGAGQQRLAGAGRADEQHAFGHTCADLLEAARRLEEVDDLADLLFDALIAGDVVEGRPGSFCRVDLGPGASYRHDA